jgi:predicted homoserine dehydrogenase-like protein
MHRCPARALVRWVLLVLIEPLSALASEPPRSNVALQEWAGPVLVVAQALVQDIDVAVEATGSPSAGVRHALLSFGHGCHVIMINVEADALVGPLLARRAQEAGVVYSLAYGDQPAIICEMVDWARATGLEVVCAGKGTKYLPEYHASTPDTVWEHYGFTDEQVESGGLNARMFNSFLDGTKSALEMAAVANATGLTPAPEGLAFPPAGTDELAAVCRPGRTAGASTTRGRSRSSPASSAMAAPWSATCAGGCT